jgi:Icc protein
LRQLAVQAARSGVAIRPGYAAGGSPARHAAHPNGQWRLVVRAKVLGDVPIEAVEVNMGDAEWAFMTPVPGAVALWQAGMSASGGLIRVRARASIGRQDEDRIEPAARSWTAPPRARDGSDRDRVGAWPSKGILDTQLGPNRNGRKW